MEYLHSWFGRLEFLQTQGEYWQQHVDFMSEFSNFRPSDAKNEWLVQTMPVNARIHKLMAVDKDGRMTEVSLACNKQQADQVMSPTALTTWCVLLLQIASYPRSGAFAVHGRRPKGFGLDALRAAQHAVSTSSGDQEREYILNKIKYKSVAALETELKIRSTCCITQALPVVVGALRQSFRRTTCLESALRTGSFLYVQQSLLSDLNTNERQYLQVFRGDRVGHLLGD